MTRRKLLAAIDSNRDDLDAYRVYADWLTEQGDPWGQIIAVQHALKTLPRFGVTERRDELEREETRLLYEHRHRLWGALADEVFDAGTQTHLNDLVEAVWHCGFLERIRIKRAPANVLAVLLPAVAKLEISRSVLELELRTPRWTRAACDALAGQAWPQVEILTIVGEEARADARWMLPAVDAMFALKKLSVATTHSTDGLCIALATHAVGDRLTMLELLDGEFTDEGIAALAGGKFSALQGLRISGSGPNTAKSMLARRARFVSVRLDLYEE